MDCMHSSGLLRRNRPRDIWNLTYAQSAAWVGSFEVM
jgi:hypothetical protein